MWQSDKGLFSFVCQLVWWLILQTSDFLQRNVKNASDFCFYYISTGALKWSRNKPTVLELLFNDNNSNISFFFFLYSIRINGFLAANDSVTP